MIHLLEYAKCKCLHTNPVYNHNIHDAPILAIVGIQITK